MRQAEAAASSSSASSSASSSSSSSASWSSSSTPIQQPRRIRTPSTDELMRSQSPVTPRRPAVGFALTPPQPRRVLKPVPMLPVSSPPVVKARISPSKALAADVVVPVKQTLQSQFRQKRRPPARPARPSPHKLKRKRTATPKRKARTRTPKRRHKKRTPGPLNRADMAELVAEIESASSSSGNDITPPKPTAPPRPTKAEVAATAAAVSRALIDEIECDSEDESAPEVHRSSQPQPPAPRRNPAGWQPTLSARRVAPPTTPQPSKPAKQVDSTEKLLAEQRRRRARQQAKRQPLFDLAEEEEPKSLVDTLQKAVKALGKDKCAFEHKAHHGAERATSRDLVVRALGQPTLSSAHGLCQVSCDVLRDPDYSLSRATVLVPEQDLSKLSVRAGTVLVVQPPWRTMPDRNDPAATVVYGVQRVFVDPQLQPQSSSASSSSSRTAAAPPTPVSVPHVPTSVPSVPAAPVSTILPLRDLEPWTPLRKGLTLRGRILRVIISGWAGPCEPTDSDDDNSDVGQCIPSSIIIQDESLGLCRVVVPGREQHDALAQTEWQAVLSRGEGAWVQVRLVSVADVTVLPARPHALRSLLCSVGAALPDADRLLSLVSGGLPTVVATPVSKAEVVDLPGRGSDSLMAKTWITGLPKSPSSPLYAQQLGPAQPRRMARVADALMASYKLPFRASLLIQPDIKSGPQVGAIVRVQDGILPDGQAHELRLEHFWLRVQLDALWHLHQDTSSPLLVVARDVLVMPRDSSTTVRLVADEFTGLSLARPVDSSASAMSSTSLVRVNLQHRCLSILCAISDIDPLQLIPF